MAHLTRVTAIHAVLIDRLGYSGSPTMSGEAYDLAERIATAVRTTDRLNRKAYPVSDPFMPANPDDLNVPTDGEPGPPCSRCGIPLPPLPVAVKRALNAGLEVELAHPAGGCPTDRPTPTGRYFEVRVSVVEIREVPDQRQEPIPTAFELISFKHGHTAKDLDAAMRPLAEGLGAKWMAAEKQARIADTPATAEEVNG